jgi:hypothetical protein
MAYKIVQIQNRVITLPDGQPAQGHWVTVQDSESGDTFSVESPSTDPLILGPIVQRQIDNRRGAANLTFG